MESFANVQEDIYVKMRKARANFKKSSKDRLTPAYLETRLENLQALWDSFTQTHKEIVSTLKKSEFTSSAYFQNGVYDEVEEFYVDYKCELKELLSQKSTVDSSADLKSCCHIDKPVNRVKLPEIKIPSFSGKYSEWQTFRDLFIGLVHENKSLDDAQRFFYLKGHLTGEAELLLRNIKVTSDNYKIAWSKLDKMYNNKRFLANGIIKRLLSQKSLSCESASEIKRLLNTTSECLEAIGNLGVDVSSWDLMIIHIISAKLDRVTRKAWELQVASDSSDELPTFEQFSDYLNSRFRGLEHLDREDTRDHRQGKQPQTKGTQSFHVVKEKRLLSCTFCSADHKITSCPKFGKESNEARRKFALENNLCFVCLLNNHSAKYCKNTLRCQVCKHRHHSLLHPGGASGSNIGEDRSTVHEEISSVASTSLKDDIKNGIAIVTAQAEGSSKPMVSCLSTGTNRKTVLLTTALIKAESKDGTYRVVRALLDQGSQGSFVTESTVQYLGLNKTPSKQVVIGVGGDKSATAKSSVVLTLRSRIDPKVEIKVDAFVLKSVTALLPATKVTRVEWVDLTDDDLADPEYYRPNKIDVLLGAEVYSQVIQEGIKKNVSGTLLAQDTKLGWILSGTFEVDQTINPSHITVMHLSLEADDMLKRFWELEAEPSRKKMLTEEENKCEQLFAATTERDSNGRYIVRLPLRDGDPASTVGETRSIAEKRLKALEVKFRKNHKFKEEYQKVIKEYLQLNHMKKVSEEDSNNKQAIYLPHHAVVREDKETSKIRVVFDASCKGTKGMSLNDNMLVGPTLQAELRHTIIRWRTHRTCLVADIIKMYRQVLVHEKDTILQRILWRDDPEKEIEEYQLVTVTFGTASAPYLAVRALQQLAHDECSDDPEIAKIILEDFYMDDVMTGDENIEACFKIYTKLMEVLEKGGFPLQKWRSKSQELLDKIRDGKGTTEELMIQMDNITKILGLTWNSNEDVFQYTVELRPLTAPVTKRKVISEISRLFDPLGWLAPSIIQAKIFIQRLWLAGLEWDQAIPNNLLQDWLTYHNSLTALMNIRIPRWMHCENKNLVTELHGFSDASGMAYSAVAEAHAKTMHGGPQIMLTYLRAKYWIIGVKLLVKKFVRECNKCIRYNSRFRTQLMGQLPSARVTPNKPFLCSGVDYAGPINIRVSKGRGNKSYKGYIALFVCMSTRAVHLEAVSELSTKGFLAAFKRFVARRGRCAKLHSDNGTNFVGAARELLYLFNKEKSSFNPDLAEYLANNGTEWHFIPPHAPNFGGLWEAGIKSTKYHLKRVIGNSTLTYEEMATVLAQIEACLNSRPLSYVEDQDKVTILTPGHFLIGEPPVLPPDSNYESKTNVTNLKRWQLHQKMMQDFWRRWSHDYLHQFLQRHKWNHKTPEPSVGSIVLIKEDNMPPGKWLLGRIEQKHPGSDGITRVVSIRTQSATIKRPTSRLCVLPLAI